ncbi:MAG: hypothetical protein J6K61_03515 [Clostridia bacterium]|nr:hypothetical protein [Clostridia bacterium]
MALNEMLQKMVNEDYDSIVNIAKSAMANVSDNLKGTLDDDQIATLLYGALGATMVVDASFSSLEQKFISDLGLDVDSMYGFLQSISKDPSMLESFDGMVDSCDQDTKSALVILVVAIAAIDERISVEETAFIRKLIEE